MEETLKKLGCDDSVFNLGGNSSPAILYNDKLNALKESKYIKKTIKEDEEKNEINPPKELKDAKANLNDLVNQFFTENPEPNDTLLHAFADKNKVDTHELETAIYKVLSSYVTGKAFKHGEDPDEDFDPEQLAAGIKVEKEHTDNELIAKAIAKSHLSEEKSYYIKLASLKL